MQTKICNKCKIEKPITSFYREGLSKDGRRTDCADCKNKNTYAWRKANQDYYNKSMSEYQKAHPRQRDDCDLKRKYGVSIKWFDDTLAEQDHKCAICRKPNPSTKRRLAVDHHHASGRVRGIVCYNCNRMLHAFDDSDLYNKIMAYLKRFT